MLFLTSFSINLIANKPEIKDVSIPISSGKTGIEVALKLNINSYKIDAKIIGIDSKKEKSATLFLSSPQRIPAHIVEPEREMPGKHASPCAMPIIMLDL